MLHSIGFPKCVLFSWIKKEILPPYVSAHTHIEVSLDMGLCKVVGFINVRRNTQPVSLEQNCLPWK
jgi:hypothetical protein